MRLLLLRAGLQPLTIEYEGRRSPFSPYTLDIRPGPPVARCSTAEGPGDEFAVESIGRLRM